MELPAALRAAVDAAVESTPAAEITAAAAILSARYRGDARTVGGRMHVSDAASAVAYAAVRMPATYGALRAAMSDLKITCPSFTPDDLLDLGSGPGTAVWAAAETWPGLQRAIAVEASPAMVGLGRRLWAGRSAETALAVEWREADLGPGVEGVGGAPSRLVVLGYVLNELETGIAALIGKVWDLASGGILIVEPGTPAGWRRVLEARAALLALGALLAGPCPHAGACPLAAPDWCHFSQRVARSRIHRLAKQGELGWEDEKFIYVAALRMGSVGRGEPVVSTGFSTATGGDHRFHQQTAGSAVGGYSRVLMPPRQASGRVWLKLCEPEAIVLERLVTRREGEVFKSARRLDWGDRFKPSISPPGGR